jgi:hypothetical protein
MKMRPFPAIPAGTKSNLPELNYAQNRLIQSRGVPPASGFLDRLADSEERFGEIEIADGFDNLGPGILLGRGVLGREYEAVRADGPPGRFTFREIVIRLVGHRTHDEEGGNRSVLSNGKAFLAIDTQQGRCDLGSFDKRPADPLAEKEWPQRGAVKDFLCAIRNYGGGAMEL